jgi:hypothetical protein
MPDSVTDVREVFNTWMRTMKSGTIVRASLLLSLLALPSIAQRSPRGLITHQLITRASGDSSTQMLERQVVANVDSLLFAELHVVRQSGAFTADSLILSREHFRQMPGMGLQIVAGPSWFFVSVIYPHIVTLSVLAMIDSGVGSTHAADYGRFRDTVTLGALPVPPLPPR